MNYDVIALGEILIDFTHNAESEQGNPVFEANPGGAPCNFLSMLSRLGRKTAFIGKVGRDMFGDMLTAAVKEVGIDPAFLMHDEKVHTTLAFVHTAENGDRDFSFYRDPGADVMLSAAEVPEDAVKAAKVFHYGSVSMTHDVCNAATRKGAEYAEQAGVLRTFDPNLRPPLWSDPELARERIGWGLAHADVVKLADNEIEWLTGTNDYDRAAASILEQYPIRLLLVSLGADGSIAYTRDRRVFAPAFRTEKTIETTGAGDTFFACCVDTVLSRGLDDLTAADLAEMLRFANLAASYVTTRRGALRVMPTREQAEAFAHE